MSTPAQQAIDNTHLHYVFIIAYARTRDYAEAKDAADNAARTLTELARLLPHFPTIPRDAPTTLHHSSRTAKSRPTATTPGLRKRSRPFLRVLLQSWGSRKIDVK